MTFATYFCEGILIDKKGVVPVKQESVLILGVVASTTLVAAVTGKKIRIISAIFSNRNALQMTFAFMSNATLISSNYDPPPLAVGPMILGPNPFGWQETVAGQALNVVTATGGAEVSINIRYIEVTPTV